jgi:hypothetical protein
MSAERIRATREGSQVVIELLNGASIIVDDDDHDGTVLLALDLGPERGGAMTRLSPPVAAYLAGQLAVRAGVRLGEDCHS